MMLEKTREKIDKNVADFRAATKNLKGECLISTDKGYVVLPEK
ncbi:MAG: hypothetical protein Q8N14_05295 [Candidatus Omnitrophota bacterium]|nr:hypothetical protein [Candidatus Omnitrophota bacterium]